MERKVRVIPFQVIEQAEKVYEIPRGVEMIQAEKIWNQTKGKEITVAILIKRTVPLGNSPKVEGNGLVYLTLMDQLSKIFDRKFAAKVLGV
jgi:hypothetical protein